jgi:predicted RNA-binding protein with PUA-like domain
MKYWLVKFAPFRTSWQKILLQGSFTLRGVRSHEACNNIAKMLPGDQVLFYHSQQELAVIGLASVSTHPFPDPTSPDPNWLTVTIKPIKTLHRPVSLKEIKSYTALQNIPLIHKPRLSVMPLTEEEFNFIISLSEKSILL